MIPFSCSWNIFTFPNLLWLLTSYSASLVNGTPPRYPHVLPKCCEPVGLPSSDGISRLPDKRFIGACRTEGSDVVLLPKQLFPAMSTEVDDVEVELGNLIEGLNCDEGPEDSDIRIDLLTPVTIGKKGTFDEVSFSGDLLTTNEHIYSPRHFCISSRTFNQTSMAIKTCKLRCSKAHLCIPRCCGGHQSILTSAPTSPNESFLDFCSSPSLTNDSWDPRTSKIVDMINSTHFSQKRYAPPIEPVYWDPPPPEVCSLLRITEPFSWFLLSEQEILLRVENEEENITARKLNNFCIDGINGVAGGIFSSPTVRLTSEHNGRNLGCPQGYEDFIVDYRNNTLKLFFLNGLLMLRGSFLSHNQFCIRSVFQNAMTIRTCKGVSGSFFTGLKCWHYLSLIIQFSSLFLIFLSTLFYVVIAVVYILRKDKDLVLRCCIVAFSISSILFCVLAYFDAIFIHLNENPSAFCVAHAIIAILIAYTFRHAFTWMSVLCLDVWLNITYLQPGRKSTKRLWGYIAFAFIFPGVLVAIRVITDFIDHKGVPAIVLYYLVHVLGYGLASISFLLFTATAVKLWITKHSCDIKNQKDTFLLYFKLFLLVGLRWIIEFILVFFPTVEEIHILSILILKLGTLIFLFLHPIVFFFFLVWDAETKRYMGSNHPRLKRVLDVISGIGYPLRKCWGLCGCRKRLQDGRTSGGGTIEPPHNSAHMYVHTTRIPKILKAGNNCPSQLQNKKDEIINDTAL